MARLAAQSIVRNGFDMKRAVAELRPDVKTWRVFGARLLDEPAIREEMHKIMDRVERSADKFMQLMWEWLNSTDTSKEAQERRVTAARILAKGYISEKPAKDAPSKPFVIEGVTQEGLANLTGDRKVM